MARSQQNVIPQFELRIDGMPDPAIRFRMSFDDPDDFDILVDDTSLGSLAITSDCVLEIREAGTEWRTVTLDELKSVLFGDSPRATEMSERRMFDRLDDIEVAHRPSSRLADLTGHADCQKRVQALFYRAGLPHRSAGTVFVVPDLHRARIVLCRAGFYPSPISPAALVEPQTRCAVQLIEQHI